MCFFLLSLPLSSPSLILASPSYLPFARFRCIYVLPPPLHIYSYLSIYLLIYLSICRMLPLLLHSPLIIFHYLFFSLKYIPSFQTVLSIASKPPDLDLPGMGKNFCIACNRYVVLYYAVFAVGHYSSVDNDNSGLENRRRGFSLLPAVGVHWHVSLGLDRCTLHAYSIPTKRMHATVTRAIPMTPNTIIKGI